MASQLACRAELMIVDTTTPPLVGSPGWEYGRFPK